MLKGQGKKLGRAAYSMFVFFFIAISSAMRGATLPGRFDYALNFLAIMAMGLIFTVLEIVVETGCENRIKTATAQVCSSRLIVRIKTMKGMGEVMLIILAAFTYAEILRMVGFSDVPEATTLFTAACIFFPVATAGILIYNRKKVL